MSKHIVSLALHVKASPGLRKKTSVLSSSAIFREVNRFQTVDSRKLKLYEERKHSILLPNLLYHNSPLNEKIELWCYLDKDTAAGISQKIKDFSTKKWVVALFHIVSTTLDWKLIPLQPNHWSVRKTKLQDWLMLRLKIVGLQEIDWTLGV